MRYIGSKRDLLSFIETAINDAVGLDNVESFSDLFSGTTVVAQHFKKKGINIISNDYMNFSYILQMAYIKNNQFDLFKKLSNTSTNPYEEALNRLNDLKSENGFFYRQYTPEGSQKYTNYSRNYFSEENGKKIDAILAKIRNWRRGRQINFIEECVLKASLIEAVASVSNTTGTYGSFLKITDSRKLKPLVLKKIKLISNKKNNQCYGEDIFSLIERVKGDVLYLDPPYNGRQYPPYYHIYETLVLDDNPDIYGITGRRPYREKISPFCRKDQAEAALLKIINQAKFSDIFVSYSDEGIIDIDNFIKSLSSFRKVDLFKFEHQRYKSNSNGSLKLNHKTNELLLWVKK